MRLIRIIQIIWTFCWQKKKTIDNDFIELDNLSFSIVDVMNNKQQ